jgi:hypothetical protein
MHLHENETGDCGQGPVADYCKLGNKSSCFTKSKECLE